MVRAGGLNPHDQCLWILSQCVYQFRHAAIRPRCNTATANLHSWHGIKLFRSALSLNHLTIRPVRRMCHAEADM